MYEDVQTRTITYKYGKGNAKSRRKLRRKNDADNHCFLDTSLRLSLLAKASIDVGPRSAFSLTPALITEAPIQFRPLP